MTRMTFVSWFKKKHKLWFPVSLSLTKSTQHFQVANPFFMLQVTQISWKNHHFFMVNPWWFFWNNSFRLALRQVGDLVGVVVTFQGELQARRLPAPAAEPFQDARSSGMWIQCSYGGMILATVAIILVIFLYYFSYLMRYECDFSGIIFRFYEL